MSNLVLNNPQPVNQTTSDIFLLNSSLARFSDSPGRLTGSFQPRSSSTTTPVLPNNPGNNNGSIGNPVITIGTDQSSGAPELPNLPDGIDMSRFTDVGEIGEDFLFALEHERVVIDLLRNDVGAVTLLSLYAPREGAFSFRLPTGATATIENNVLVYDSTTFHFNIPPGYAFQETIEYQVMMEDGSLQSGAVTFFVLGVNDAPVAQDDQFEVNTFGVLSVIPAPGVGFNDFDPDGDFLQVSLVSGPAHGTLFLDPSGQFEYDPDDGFVGTDSFVYRTSDGALSDTATVTITVANGAPVATDDEYSMVHDDTLVVLSDADVLENDFDPDGNPLTVALVSGPFDGTLTLNADGTFTYEPDPFFVGFDTFTYSVTDGVGSDTATVTITVTNEDPVAGDDIYAVDQDSVLNVSAASGVVTNDVDGDGDTLVVANAAVVTGPSNGTVNINEDGSFDYTPDPGFFGEDSFTYEVTDGIASDIATVTITVNEVIVNQAPFANEDNYSTDEGVPLFIPGPGVLDNDTDPEGDSLNILFDTDPANGTLTLFADGGFDYTPDSGFTGTDSFTYQIDDGNGNVVTGTVFIEVFPMGA